MNPSPSWLRVGCPFLKSWRTRAGGLLFCALASTVDVRSSVKRTDNYWYLNRDYQICQELFLSFVSILPEITTASVLKLMLNRDPSNRTDRNLSVQTPLESISTDPCGKGSTSINTVSLCFVRLAKSIYPVTLSKIMERPVTAH